MHDPPELLLVLLLALPGWLAYTIFASSGFVLFRMMAGRLDARSRAEVICFFIPWAVWFSLMLSPLNENKAWGNMLAEPLILGVLSNMQFVPLVFARGDGARKIALILGTTCAAAAAISVFLSTDRIAPTFR